MKKEKIIDYTHEQIERIAETLHVITFEKDPKTKEWLVLEYPRVNLFHQSCIWDKPSFDYDHQREVRQVFPPFEATHTYTSPSLFKPSLAEVIQAMPTDLIGEVNAVRIRPDGFTDGGSKHKSVVYPYRIEEKRAKEIPPVVKEDENKLHPSPLKIEDLVGTILDEYIEVSIDVAMPEGRFESVWSGPLNDVPEEYLCRKFRPIQLWKEWDDCIHLIVN